MKNAKSVVNEFDLDDLVAIAFSLSEMIFKGEQALYSRHKQPLKEEDLCNTRKMVRMAKTARRKSFSMLKSIGGDVEKITYDISSMWEQTSDLYDIDNLYDMDVSVEIVDDISPFFMDMEAKKIKTVLKREILRYPENFIGEAKFSSDYSDDDLKQPYDQYLFLSHFEYMDDGKEVIFDNPCGISDENGVLYTMKSFKDLGLMDYK